MNVSEVRLYRQKRRNLRGSFSELAGLSPASALEFKTHQHLREWESAASGGLEAERRAPPSGEGARGQDASLVPGRDPVGRLAQRDRLSPGGSNLQAAQQ